MNVLSLFAGIGGLDRLGQAVVVAVKDQPTLSHEVEADRFKLGVQQTMLRASANEQVLPTIVQLVSVDVVNNLSSSIEPPSQAFLGNQDVFRDILVRPPILGRKDDSVTPSVDELTATPGRMIGTLPAGEFRVGYMSPASAVVVEGLLSHAERNGDRPPTLTSSVSGLDFLADDRQSGRRHGDILS